MELECEADEMLIEVLRREGLGSVRATCGIGVCGACTVLVDGEPVSGCLTLAPQVAERDLTTVEGLGGDDPVQRAFVDAHGFQCGWCTPGFVLTAKALLADNPDPSERADRRGAGRKPLPLRVLREDRGRGAARRIGLGGAAVRLVTYDAGAGPRVGVQRASTIVDAGFEGDMVAFIAAGAPLTPGAEVGPAPRLLAPLAPALAARLSGL